MKLLRNLPIQQKVLAMTLLICGAVLCVSIGSLFVFQVLNFRANLLQDTGTQADIAANNSTAALDFGDERGATEVVTALRASANLKSATLVLTDGKFFSDASHSVHYGRAGMVENGQTLAQFPPPGGYRFVGGDLLVTRLVRKNPFVFGTLYLRADYQQTFLGLCGIYGLVVAGILVVSAALAGFLSRRLGRTITDPVLQLAQTAQVVGDKKDYSVRAVVDSRGDEVATLAESFNQMLGRIQSQDAALHLSQQKIEALIHSIDGIVWERSPDTFRFSFVSRQSKEILGYPPEAWLDNPTFWDEKIHPQDLAKTPRSVQELASPAASYLCEYRVFHAEGRIVWIRESGTVLSENGRPVAIRGIFLDVTRQKQDAEQLDKLNRQLMTTSRLAGMAEVATGVLHNVGNVLNSVSVAATVVGERLRNSKLANLRRATDLMRQQNGHLAEFLTSDPKGKLIPEYLTTVAEQMAAEEAKLIAKMESVTQNIEHIKEIVAMQQGYAKVSGVFENLPVDTLVEDALRMNAAAFDRHGIVLVREFADDLPMVRVDRHKVLQILINLIRNAKYAMDAKGGDLKRLVVRVAMASSDRVRITVADNGVGIAPEHLTRIFNHGFTTKKDGHGFGLHSGANAAKEMGGALSARSEGRGHGADFTLELPAASVTQPFANQRIA